MEWIHIVLPVAAFLIGAIVFIGIFVRSRKGGKSRW